MLIRQWPLRCLMNGYGLMAGESEAGPMVQTSLVLLGGRTGALCMGAPEFAQPVRGEPAAIG